MSGEDLARELDRGGKFVVFQYTISIVIMTFKRSSSIRFVKAGEGTFAASLPYTLLTLFLGWWGIPWGPIYSIAALFSNLSGGKDVTSEVLGSLTEA
jgi:hypothetical protein